MIFVTVGTHEQPFDRLIQEVDKLKGEGQIEDEVIIQTGYSMYKPKYCKWSRLIPYEEMEINIANADIVITHGGPASFIAPLQVGKIPVVVPRQKKFGEHVNDHQLEFCRQVESRLRNIILIEDVSKLNECIAHYCEYCKALCLDMNNHNVTFNEQLEQIVCELGV